MWQAISYYVVLTLESLIGVFGIRLYEEPRYDVIDRIADRVEVRRYAPRPAAEVEAPVGGKAGRNEAFRRRCHINWNWPNLDDQPTD